MLDGWKYCPRCAAELEIHAGRVECHACGFELYPHSSPTANALVEDEEGRLLLARRAREPYRGRWDIPGGFLQEGEHPLDALRRELREETGLEVEPDAYLGAFMDRYGDGPSAHATLNLFWTARVTTGEPLAADDVSELRWFAVDELPSGDELAFALIPAVLEAWRDQHA